MGDGVGSQTGRQVKALWALVYSILLFVYIVEEHLPMIMDEQEQKMN
jgi:hypothetical protein